MFAEMMVHDVDLLDPGTNFGWSSHFQNPKAILECPTVNHRLAQAFEESGSLQFLGEPHERNNGVESLTGGHIFCFPGT